MSDDDPDRDPFGRLEESASDREGDPFESLADPDADERTGTDPRATSDAVPSSEPMSESPDSEAGARADAADATVGPGTPETDAGEPGSSDDPFTSPDSTLGHVDVGDVDGDEIWAAISRATDRGSVADAGGRTYAEVSKHRFCEGCKYFSDPPDVGCSHEGTEILAFLDVETVRLVDCPIVEERRELERGER